MEEQLLDTEIESLTKQGGRNNTLVVILLGVIVLVSFCCIAVFSMPPSLIYALTSVGYLIVFILGFVSAILLSGKSRWLIFLATITSSLAFYLLMDGDSSGEQMQTYGLLISIYSTMFFGGILIAIMSMKKHK